MPTKSFKYTANDIANLLVKDLKEKNLIPEIDNYKNPHYHLITKMSNNGINNTQLEVIEISIEDKK